MVTGTLKEGILPGKTVRCGLQYFYWNTQLSKIFSSKDVSRQDHDRSTSATNQFQNTNLNAAKICSSCWSTQGGHGGLLCAYHWRGTSTKKYRCWPHSWFPHLKWPGSVIHVLFSIWLIWSSGNHSSSVTQLCHLCWELQLSNLLTCLFGCCWWGNFYFISLR